MCASSVTSGGNLPRHKLSWCLGLRCINILQKSPTHSFYWAIQHSLQTLKSQCFVHRGRWTFVSCCWQYDLVMAGLWSFRTSTIAEGTLLPGFENASFLEVSYSWPGWGWWLNFARILKQRHKIHLADTLINRWVSEYNTYAEAHV